MKIHQHRYHSLHLGDATLHQNRWLLLEAKALDQLPRLQLQVDAGISYDVKISFNGSDFNLSVNDSLLLSMTKAGGSEPLGTVAFQVKNTTGSLDYISAR